MTYTLSSLIARFGGQLLGEDREIKGIASLTSASAQQISFLSSARFKHQLANCQAGAFIVPQAIADSSVLGSASLIISDDPYLYFAKVAQLFTPQKPVVASVHPTVVTGSNTQVADSCEIAAHVVLGNNVQIGERCRIHAGVVVGDDVVLGDDTVLFANVVIYDGVMIGERCRIHAGVVIGSDGFGLAWDRENNNWFKIPQTGVVRIGNNVEIGANSTVDRGALDDTVIEDNVKIDNLVQIAHNVRIGQATAIAGCAGVSGSTDIGANCLIGGAVMFSGHLKVEDGTIIGGGTAVTKSLSKDHYASFFPLMKHKDWTKNATQLRHLYDMSLTIKTLEKKIEHLTEKLEPNA